MPGGIDYSKWDNLDEYSDDDDGGGGGDHDGGNPSSDAFAAAAAAAGHPRVTRLEAPSSVTFGGGTNVVQATTSSSSSSSTPAPLNDSKASKPTVPAKAAAKAECDQKWKEKGGVLSTVDNRELYWAQDRYSVTLRCQLFDNEKLSFITVEGILPFSDRHCAMGSSKPHLKAMGADTASSVLLEGDLPHSVHLANDEDEVDWCIERDEATGKKRFLAITLYKAVPMQGLFIWWKRPLMEFDETTVIDQEPSAASKEFLKAWEEAHKLFKDKKREPQVPL